MILFLKGKEECNLVKAHLEKSKCDGVAILDDSAANINTSLYMLKCIEEGHSDIKIVLSTNLVS